MSQRDGLEGLGWDESRRQPLFAVLPFRRFGIATPAGI